MSLQTSATDLFTRSSDIARRMRLAELLAADAVQQIRELETKLRDFERRVLRPSRERPSSRDAVCEKMKLCDCDVVIVHLSAFEALERSGLRSTFTTIDGRSLTLFELRLLATAAPIMVALAACYESSRT